SDGGVRMPDAAGRTTEPITLDGAKCLLVEIDRLCCVGDDQVRDHAVVAVGDRFHRHRRLLAFCANRMLTPIIFERQWPGAKRPKAAVLQGSVAYKPRLATMTLWCGAR